MPFLRGGQKHPLLGSRAVRGSSSRSAEDAQTPIPFHFIVIDNKLLLQYLDSIQAVRLLLLSQIEMEDMIR